MLEILHRKMYRTNGLIDDFVSIGKPGDYVDFSERVQEAIYSNSREIMKTKSEIIVEISLVERRKELFTSLQNKDNDYLTLDHWENRNILRMMGNKSILKKLRSYLLDISGRGKGYSYLSECSGERYSGESPEWRLEVNET